MSLYFNYTGAMQEVVLDAGFYSLECFGAQGLNINGGEWDGKGGYAGGIIELTEQTTLNIYVGGKPTGASGGWNGGGNGYKSAYSYAGSYGGGGASDIRIGGTELSNRVIVAAGGGGGHYLQHGGGKGGGLTGGDAASNTFYATGATQTGGGTSNNGTVGTLGQGASTSQASVNHPGGGGGGGYYGGAAANGNDSQGASGGAGGSSYVGDLLNAETLSGVWIGNGLIAITPVASGSVELEAVSLSCVADCDTYAGDSNNHGASAQMNILSYDGYLGQPHIKFDLSSLPGIDESKIRVAELRFYYFGHQENDPTFAIKRVLADWSESTLIYSNQPARSASYLDCAALSGYGWKSYDILSLVKEWVAETYPNYGLVLEGISNGYRQNSYLYTKEYNSGQYAPYLYVEYETESESPHPSLSRRRFIQLV